MEKSKVYFTNMRTKTDVNLQEKLSRLLKKAGIGTIDFNQKYTAVKMHFGEPGNLAYLRPNYAKTVVDVIRELGGKPFLTDCNTLYVGGRKNALDHIDSAYTNGFSPLFHRLSYSDRGWIKGYRRCIGSRRRRRVCEGSQNRAGHYGRGYLHLTDPF